MYIRPLEKGNGGKWGGGGDCEEQGGGGQGVGAGWRPQFPASVC